MCCIFTLNLKPDIMKKVLLIIGTICLIAVLSINNENETNLLALNDTDEKVVICHIPPGNPDNAHAIEVSINAVDAHLAHGDSIGDCSNNDADVPASGDDAHRTNNTFLPE
jgi:hypothetical protein